MRIPRNTFTRNSDPIFFLFHLSLLVIFSLISFGHNPGKLLIGNDGPMMISLAQEQLQYFGISTDLHTNFLQGLGNLSFPINVSAMPAFWFGLGASSVPLIYTWFAALSFVSVIIMGINHGFSRGARYAGAWLLTLLFFPMFPFFLGVRIYPITSSAPSFVIYIFAAAIADTALCRMGKGRWRNTVFYTALLALGILTMLVTSPVALILIVPFLGISALISFFNSNRAERSRTLIAVFGLLLIFTAMGWVEFVAGLLLSSSSSFFLKEMMASYSPDLAFVSILFHGKSGGMEMGPDLFISGSLGALIALFVRDVRLRAGAITILIGQVLLTVVGGLAIHQHGGWSGPAPIYAELPFFALYALFAAYLVDLLLRQYSAFIPAFLHHSSIRYFAPIGLVTMLTALLYYAPAVRERNPSYYALSPSSTVLTDILEKEIGIRPGAPFAGRVVSYIPGEPFAPQFNYFSGLNVAVRNDHQSTGLWLKSIPTLLEYNQLITPEYYRLVKGFLSAPGDLQNRSWTNFSQIDPNMLRLLGVRFILSPARPGVFANERATLTAPAIETLRLYEIDGANVAGISARSVTVVREIKEAEEQMRVPDFDLHNAVIMDQDAKTPAIDVRSLVPVESSAISIEKGGYRIHARSNGMTLLILPIEFSRCVDVAAVSGDVPKMLRVDIALTGLLFKSDLDITLINRIGPFTHPRCRFRDYKDFKALL